MSTSTAPVYIFDTDMGNDVDDLLAQILLIRRLARTGGEFGAAVVNKGNRLAPAFVDLINRLHGCSDVPVGWCPHGPSPREGAGSEVAFLRPVLREAGSGVLDYDPDTKDWPDAVAVLRRTLAEAEDGSVVYISIGFATVLAGLLDSPPDEVSPLDGRELLRTKVRFVSAMAGEFAHLQGGGPPHLEHNIVGDIASAARICAGLPVPIVFSGFEVGNRFCFPGRELHRAFADKPGHPLPRSYELYCGFHHDRPLWDLTTVLHALAPEEGYFDLSPPGTVTVGADGATHFSPDAAGRHRHLKIKPGKHREIMDLFVRHCLARAGAKKAARGRPTALAAGTP
jgi:inosine-uridine nucleoside N-ribohydrolase